jgi:23S rRNA (uridine2552-2'-O)-methyltransferase
MISRKSDKPGSGHGGTRALKVRVRTAKKRRLSSTLWLERQLNDPYVAQAKREGYRSRAAYKLSEIADKFGLLHPGNVVVDLGAAPGGWSQVVAERIKAADGDGALVAIDLSEMAPIPGAAILHADFMEADAPQRIIDALGGRKADAVLSDMAAPATGHPGTDHLRIMGLAEVALDFALQILAPGGWFLCKVLQGGTERALLDTMKRQFATVRHVKPRASRADSAELYVLASGFRGNG